jgi:hypothetical protein
VRIASELKGESKRFAQIASSQIWWNIQVPILSNSPGKWATRSFEYYVEPSNGRLEALMANFGKMPKRTSVTAN